MCIIRTNTKKGWNAAFSAQSHRAPHRIRVRFAPGWGKHQGMKARIHITLKNGVLDPQGKATEHALGGLGFGGINDVRQGKYIELDLAESDPTKARATVDAMCQKLLANTVIENYEIDLDE